MTTDLQYETKGATSVEHDPTTVLLREASDNDEQFLKEMVYVGAYESDGFESFGVEKISFEEYQQSEAQLIHELCEDWGKPDDFGLVATRGDSEKVGAAWYRKTPEDAHSYLGYGPPHLIEISVKEEYRGQGIGRKLFEGLLEHAYEEGIPHLSLMVSAHNEAAQALYKNLGFKLVEDWDWGSMKLMVGSTHESIPPLTSVDGWTVSQ